MSLSSNFTAPYSLASQYYDFTAHLCETEGYSSRGAEKASDELFKFLTVCSLYPALRFTPSVIVDKVWRALLLFPELYSGMCSKLPLGRNVPYNPRRSKDPEGDQKMRYMTARNVLSSTFPHIPLDAYYWPEERSEVSLRKRAREDEGEGIEKSTKKSAWGSPPPGQAAAQSDPEDKVTFTVIGFGTDTRMKMRRNTRFSKLKETIAAVKGLDFDSIYLADADGVKLDEDATPLEYGVTCDCEMLVGKKRS